MLESKEKLERTVERQYEDFEWLQHNFLTQIDTAGLIVSRLPSSTRGLTQLSMVFLVNLCRMLQCACVRACVRTCMHAYMHAPIAMRSSTGCGE